MQLQSIASVTGYWYSCVTCGPAYQSTVKLEWFMYTVGLVVLTSRYITLSIWIHNGILEHAVLHTQQCLHRPETYMTHQHGYHGKSARSLESVHFAYTHHWLIGLIGGIMEAMQEKVKIDERVGLARPNV